jgi:hypothetical protein
MDPAEGHMGANPRPAQIGVHVDPPNLNSVKPVEERATGAILKVA